MATASAAAAAAAEHQPAKDGDVVVGLDLGQALRAARARSHERDAERKPVSDDVEKGSDEEAEEAGDGSHGLSDRTRTRGA
jgi:hypothetical protein